MYICEQIKKIKCKNYKHLIKQFSDCIIINNYFEEFCTNCKYISEKHCLFIKKKDIKFCKYLIIYI